MQRILFKDGDEPLWIDVVNPAADELTQLSETYGLHPELIHDCMQPEHLPKHELFDETTFMIVRYYDSACDLADDSVQSMTRKLALFLGDRFLISVHRREVPFLESIIQRHSRTSETPVYLQAVLLDLLMAAVETYHRPLEHMETRIHRYESSLFQGLPDTATWEEVFRIKSRLSVIKRILWHTLNAIQKFIPSSDANLPQRQNLRERIDSLLFFADSLLDDLNNLLNIQLSLATHRANEATNRTNEVVKVLTIFSAFFLPLNFIVGIYGMNFVHMPELQWKYGYLGVWGVLATTTTLIYVWFHRKGWIRWGHLS